MGVHLLQRTARSGGRFRFRRNRQRFVEIPGGGGGVFQFRRDGAGVIEERCVAQADGQRFIHLLLGLGWLAGGRERPSAGVLGVHVLATRDFDLRDAQRFGRVGGAVRIIKDQFAIVVIRCVDGGAGGFLEFFV